MQLLSTERSKLLADQNGWSLAYAQGFVDGQAARRLGEALMVHVRVGIDQYSLGFRAGYFERPNIDSRIGSSAPAATRRTQYSGTPVPRSVPRKFSRVL